VNIALRSLAKTADESVCRQTSANATRLRDKIAAAATAYNLPSSEWEGPEHEALAGLLMEAYRLWNIPVAILAGCEK